MLDLIGDLKGIIGAHEAARAGLTRDQAIEAVERVLAEMKSGGTLPCGDGEATIRCPECDASNARDDYDDY